MDLVEITEEWLKKNGYDGLYYDGECACIIGDLMPCGEPSPNCQNGYKVPCDCGEHDWHVSENGEKS